MVEVFTSIYVDLEVIGYKHKLHLLDNECSCAVRKFLKIKNTARKKVEAHHHNTNAADQAVKSTRYHIISHVTTIDASCLIQLWR